MPSPPFDRVIIRSMLGERSCTLAEFLDLPLHVRIGHILRRELAFFRNREPFDVGEGLRLLRELPLGSTEQAG